MSGTLNVGADGSYGGYDGVLVAVPAGMAVHAIELDAQGAEVLSPLCALPLVVVDGNEDGIQGASTGPSDAERFLVSVGDFSFRARSIAFTRAGGLSAQGLSYLLSRRVPAGSSSAEATGSLPMEFMAIGFPPHYGLAGSGSGTLQVFITMAEDGKGGTLEAYRVSAASGLAVSSRREAISGYALAPLSFDAAFFERMPGLDLRAPGGGNDIPLVALSVLPGGREAEGTLSSGSAMVLQGLTYALVNAEIRGRFLVVNEATISLPEGYLPRTARVRNFMLDGLSRTVSRGKYFSVDPIRTISSSGQDVFMDAFSFDAAGRLLAEGRLVTGTEAMGTLAFQGMGVSDEGLDMDRGGTLDGFSLSIHGFTLSCATPRYTGRGLELTPALLQYQGGTLLRGLILSLGVEPGAPGSIIQAGVSDARLDSPYQFSGGAAVRFHGLSLEEGGLFTTAGIPVDAAVFSSAAEGYLSIPRTRLYPDAANDRGSGIWGTLPSTGISLGGYQAQAAGVSFDGTALSVETLRVQAPTGFQPGEFFLVGARFTADGLATAPSLDVHADYAFSGWNAAFERIVLDHDGLGGPCALALPEALGGSAMEFPLMRVRPDGTVLSGTVAATLMAAGWPLSLTGASIEKGPYGSYGLRANEAILSLESLTEGATIYFLGARAESGGSISFGSLAGALPAITSLNGYAIAPTACRILSDRIDFAGSISCPAWTGGPVLLFSQPSIHLWPDGKASAETAASATSYAYADWTISGNGAAFGLDAVSFSSSSVVYENDGESVTVPFGAASFYADGTMARAGYNDLSMALPIFGGRVTTVCTIMDAYGLSAEAFASMPAELGGDSLYIDRVYLHRDGSFQVEATIERFEYEFETMKFEFEDLRLDADGFSIGWGLITLPESLESTRIELTSFAISNDGQFSLGGSRVDPFTLFGVYFQIDDISVTPDPAGGSVFSFQGAVGLPMDMPGQLAGRLVKIKDFRFGTRAGMLSFDIALDGDFVIPIAEGWSVIATEFGSRWDAAGGWPVITLKKASLLFPSEFSIVQSVNVTGISLSLNPFKLNLEGMSVDTDIPVRFQGFEFTLKNLSFTNSSDPALRRFGFSGYARAYPESGMPEFLVYTPQKKTQFAIVKFEIMGDGSLGDVSLRAENLDGKIVGMVSMRGGAVSVTRSASGSLAISAEGTVGFNEEAPADLRTKALALHAFRYENGAIRELSASVEGLDFIFNGLAIHGRIGLGWNADTLTGLVDIGGVIILPATMPGALANAAVEIKKFKFDTAGNFEPIEASFSTAKAERSPDDPSGPWKNEFTAFGGVNMRDVTLAVKLDFQEASAWFSVAGTLILRGADFPSGIRGSTVTCADISFSSSGGLERLDVSLGIPDQTLYDYLRLTGAILRFQRSTDRSMVIGIQGGLSLAQNPNIPSGLEGLALTVRAFSLDQDGTIRDCDIGVDDINPDLFNASVGIRGGSIALKKGVMRNEIIIDIKGSAQIIAQAAPVSLKGDGTHPAPQLKINAFTISTVDGLTAFDVALAGQAVIPIYGQVTATVTTIALSKEGMSFGAMVTLPASYGFEGAVSVGLKKLSFDWGWRLTAIEGGVLTATAKVGGFSLSITNLLFQSDRISLGSCSLTLPVNFDRTDAEAKPGQENSIGFKNAYFIASTGEFRGELDCKKLEASYGGFTVRLVEPKLDIPAKKIAFKEAAIMTPQFVGGLSYSVSGLSLSPAGLRISGATIGLPAFDIGTADGGAKLGFGGVKVVINIYETPVNGEYFSIDGSGGITVPNLGGFDVKVGFTNVVPNVYPLGLKYAGFSFSAPVPGIALGSTGMFLNQIRGALSFGPLSNSVKPIPEQIAMLFTPNGTRIELGVTLSDGTAKVITGDVDMWIDVTHWAFAIRGQMTLMKGTLNLSAYVTAAISKLGFAAGVEVQIAFIRGEIYVYIFPRNGKTYFSGAGNLRFFIPKHFIKWGLIKLPSAPMEFGGLYMEFGTFTVNGAEKKGFKGVVSLPIVGKVGAFVDQDKKLTLGKDVVQLALIKPSAGTPSASVSNPPVKAAIVQSRSASVYSTDRRELEGAGGEGVYGFSVPARRKSVAPPPAALISKGPVRAAIQEGQAAEGAFERVIVACGYLDGAPSITAISPSGIRYRPDQEGVETEYQECGLVFAILSPETGDWSVEVANAGSGGVDVAVYATNYIPSIAIDSPAAGTVEAADSLSARGRCSESSGTVRLYLSARLGERAGMPAVEVPVAADGSWTALLDLDAFPAGTYSLYAEYDRGDGGFSPSVLSDALISIRADEAALEAPAGFLVGLKGSDRVSLSWRDNNAMRASGYLVEHRPAGSETVTQVWAGDILSLELQGFEPGAGYEFRVMALRADGASGPATDWARLTMGGTAASVNLPLPASASITGLIGDTVEGVLSIPLANPAEREGAEGYLAFDVAALPESCRSDPEDPLTAMIGLRTSDRLKASGGTVELPFTLILDERLPSGGYDIVGKARNLSDPGSAAAFSIHLDATYPALSLASIEPARVRRGAEETVELSGSGFLPGLRAFLGGRELSFSQGLLRSNAAVLTIPADIPAGESSIRLLGTDGQEASLPFSVYQPDWQGILRVSSASAPAGGSFDYPLSISGRDGFSGIVTFSPSGLPDGWTAQLPSGTAGQTIILRFSSPADAAEGSYALSAASADGKTVRVTAIVTALPHPEISGLSTTTAYASQAIEIYGSGFGTGGQALLNGKAMAASFWSPGLVRATLPADAATGSITISSSGAESAPCGITILARGLSLRGPEATLAVEAGGSITTNIALLGSSDEALLAATAEGGLSVRLSAARATPFAQLALTIGAAGVKPGYYTVTLSASAGGTTAVLPLSVKVGQPFEILGAALPEAMAGEAYWTRVKTSGASGQVTMSLSGGTLPEGLAFSSDGTISGVATETGTHSLRLQALDAAGIPVSATLSLTVSPAGWAETAGNGGQTRFRAGEAPGIDAPAWRTEISPGAASIVSGSGRLWLRDDAGISAYRDGTGDLAYRLVGSYPWYAYSGGRLWTLNSSGELSALDPVTAKRLFSRSGVLSAGADGARILACTATSADLISSGDGTLLESLPFSAQSGDGILWLRGQPLVKRGGSILELRASGALTFFQRPATLSAAAADSQGMAVLDSAGSLSLLSPEGVLLAWKDTGLLNAKLALGPAQILAYNAQGSLCLERGSLQTLWTSGGAAAAALASEKAFLAGQTGLQALNLQSGKAIWTVAGTSTAVATYQGAAYACISGRLDAYKGTDNPSGPTTRIIAAPEEPTGTNGWYTSIPALRIESDDAESRVQSIWYKQGEGAWTEYGGALALTEGDHEITAYGVDNHGLTGELANLRVRIDLTPPTVTETLPAAKGQNGWQLEPLSLTLDATDSLSGMLRTDLAINGTDAGFYSQPIAITTAGIHSIAWTARDLAGNASSGTREIKLDLAEPVSSLSLKTAEGIALVELSASDDASGVVKTEYRLDGSPRDYATAFTVLSPGSHRLEYRSLDASGRAEAWKTKDFSILAPRKRSPLAVWAQSGSSERTILPFVEPGTLIWEDCAKSEHEARLFRMPRDLIGSNYLWWKKADKDNANDPLASFWVRDDVAIHLFVHPDSQADMTGWTLIESGVRVNDLYFSAGAKHYLRHAAGGTKVTLPAQMASATSSPPLVFIKEAREVRIDLSLKGKGRSYLVGETLGVKVKIIGESAGLTLEYNLSDAYGAVTILDSQGSLPYNLAAGTYLLSARALEPDGWVAGSAELELEIRSDARISIIWERPDQKFHPGKPYRLTWVALLADGKSAEGVAWEESADGLSWTGLDLRPGGDWMSPAQAGRRILRAQWDDGTGKTMTKLFEITVESGE